MKTRLIMDTDPSVDDAHAIMMSLAYPETSVEALTTVAGALCVLAVGAASSIPSWEAVRRLAANIEVL
jgi:inosine-uridine nucleoside N-ribohydrolase